MDRMCPLAYHRPDVSAYMSTLKVPLRCVYDTSYLSLPPLNSLVLLPQFGLPLCRIAPRRLVALRRRVRRQHGRMITRALTCTRSKSAMQRGCVADVVADARCPNAVYGHEGYQRLAPATMTSLLQHPPFSRSR